MLSVINVVGARPNFMKMAPIVEAMRRHPDRIDPVLVHTGQHYDERMSESFFSALGMPEPDINLGVGSGSHAEQTARVMVEFEKICISRKPDLVVVVGDVNSTLACTLAARKLGIRVAHVEAGLRSRDMSMPEEINRLCTDAIADLLFTTDHYANENLAAEGVAPGRVFFVGNVMIDTLLKHREMAARSDLSRTWQLAPRQFATLTLHRPSNVDDPGVFAGILDALRELTDRMPVIFPIHPRTRKTAERFGLSHRFESGGTPRGLWITEPLGYLEMLHLNMNARVVVTDSGGVQEETTVLGVPCVTLRNNTERPITCEVGTNAVVGNDPARIRDHLARVLEKEEARRSMPEKWDGKAAERIVEVLLGL